MLILILELGFMLYPLMILATSDKKISLFKAKLDNIGANHLRGLVGCSGFKPEAGESQNVADVCAV